MQVKMMKDIYTSASEVYAWIGLPSDENETMLARKLMRDFHVFLRNGLQRTNDDINAVLAGVDASHPGFPDRRGSLVWQAWDGIAEICNAPYWMRVWIFQEATVPGPVKFFCGNFVFNDTLLSAAVSFSEVFVGFPGFDKHFQKSCGNARNVWNLLMARRNRARSSTRPLIDLMLEIGLAECSDPRDRIYAPLGHVSSAHAGYVWVRSSQLSIHTSSRC